MLRVWSVDGAGDFLRLSPDSEPDTASLGGRGVVLRTDDQPVEGGVFRGEFEEVSRYVRREGDPDPFSATGIMLVLIDNLDPEQHAGYEAWYDQVHMPDITGAAGFWGARRYRNVAADPGPDSTGTLAVYVTDAEDVMGEYEKVKAVAPGLARWHATRRFHVAVYRRTCST